MKVFFGRPERGYDFASVEDVPLWGMIRIETELGISGDQIPDMLQEAVAASELPAAQRSGGRMMLAVGLMIWMARMSAGERCGFEEACDFPIATIRIQQTEAEKAAAEKAAADAAAEAARAAALVAGGEGVRPTGPAGSPAAPAG